MSLDIQAVRTAFPALASEYLYADNAGGSQCLGDVVSKISDYLLNTNVQLGADYSVSVTSTNRVSSGAEAARELFNAASVDEIAYGSSSTMLVENLARAIEADVQPGEEIIVTGEHECESDWPDPVRSPHIARRSRYFHIQPTPARGRGSLRARAQS